MDCSRCGGEVRVVSPDWDGKSGGFLTFECTECGETFSALVDPAPPRSKVPPKRVRVWIEWAKRKPSSDEVKAIRDLIPELQHRALRDVWMEAQAAERWEVGSLWEWQAEELRKRAKD